jgi:phage head maturation protease
LHLEIDDKGLRYWFKIGKSALHQELAELIERGDIFSSSFAFTVREDVEKWDSIGDGMYKRTITKFDELFDVSPVFRPAYEATTVGKRSVEMIEKLKAEELQVKAKEQPKEEPQPEQKPEGKDVSEYYKKYNTIIQQLSI